jgi:acetyl esterase/lipase
VPARREDLAGLAPAWVGVGSCDLFHDEDLAYARRLEEHGVPCETVVVPGAFHGFDVTFPNAPVSREFRRGYVEALRRALFATPLRGS